MGTLSHSLSAHLIPAYGFDVVRLSLQPNHCTFVQSRAEVQLAIPMPETRWAKAAWLETEAKAKAEAEDV